MTDTWLSHRERGSGFLIRLIVFLSLKIGQPVGRALLYPICLYFYFAAPKAKSASLDYLSRVQGRPARFADVFRHILTFARVILDRPFFLVGKFQKFKIDVHGMSIVENLRQRNQGCVLLGAHIGSFEVLRALAVEHDVAVKALMYPENSQRISGILNALNPGIANDIIPLGQKQSLISAKNFIDKGGMVGILGDRGLHGQRSVTASFLGKPAEIPIGALMLAGALRVPVVFFVGVYRGNRHYEIHFEEFAETLPVTRRSSPEDLGFWVEKYVQRLEHYCKLAPNNWFNFFDFWGQQNEDRS